MGRTVRMRDFANRPGGHGAPGIERYSNQPTEILDLSMEGNTWQTLPADMDVPDGDYGDSYSFVASVTEPTTGYFMPTSKDYMYRVTCADASSCSFEKINTGYRNPHHPVTMAVQPESRLTCP